ncbi:hypothetical protein [Lactococcus allomyrinae]|uniref:DUF5067 domain-containing protein n=1 Tax=Lactococcus allomyrinae TaxID=2419773 RepID=A0A387BI35_9LACT|nr:hypothetical protein [Lactococcus allomyrinae]AYG01039.1 hypothetical protein D7I46_08035 [Lactococcus allomyrinae]
MKNSRIFLVSIFLVSIFGGLSACSTDHTISSTTPISTQKAVSKTNTAFQIGSDIDNGATTLTGNDAKVIINSYKLTTDASGAKVMRFVITFDNKTNHTVNLVDFVKNRVQIHQMWVSQDKKDFPLKVNTAMIANSEYEKIKAHDMAQVVFDAEILTNQLSQSPNDNILVLGISQKAGNHFAGGMTIPL